jgi:hypothetical protein
VTLFALLREQPALPRANLNRDRVVAFSRIQHRRNTAHSVGYFEIHRRIRQLLALCRVDKASNLNTQESTPSWSPRFNHPFISLNLLVSAGVPAFGVPLAFTQYESQALQRFESSGEFYMAKVIEFYVRDLTPKVKWVPPEQRGKLIEFAKPVKKSA